MEIYELLTRIFLLATSIIILSIVNGQAADEQHVEWSNVQNIQLGELNDLFSGGLILKFDAFESTFKVVVNLDKSLEEKVKNSNGLALTGSDLLIESDLSDSKETFELDIGQFILFRNDKNLSNVADLTVIDFDKRSSEMALIGNFQFKNVIYSIFEGGQISRRSIFWKLKDEQGQSLRCGSDNLTYNKASSWNFKGETSATLKGRSTFEINNAVAKGIKKSSDKGVGNDIDWDKQSTERMPSCPSNPKLLPIAIVADCNYVKRMGGVEAARRQLLAEMSTVSKIFFTSFNIGISLTSIILYEECDGHEIWDSPDVFNIPCSNYPGLEVILNRFSRWRDEGLGDQDAPSAAIVHLVTACHFSDQVGLAWINQVCRVKSFRDSMADTISGTSVSIAVFAKSIPARKEKSLVAMDEQHIKSPIESDKKLSKSNSKNLWRKQKDPVDGAMDGNEKVASKVGLSFSQQGGQEAGAEIKGKNKDTNIKSKVERKAEEKVQEVQEGPDLPIFHYAVIAHELAHSLGAVHDCSSKNCEIGGQTDSKSDQCSVCRESEDGCDCGDKFLMSPNIGNLLKNAPKNGWFGDKFSRGSIVDVCGKLSYLGSCLIEESGLMSQQGKSFLASEGSFKSANAGRVDQFSLEQILKNNLIAQCGNGIREGDEECDCGGPDGCKGNPCCTVDCKLKAGAFCSDQNDTCCKNCKFIPSNKRVLCRSASVSGGCLEDAYCDGSSGSCPSSLMRADGTDCGKTLLLNGESNGSEGKCASGVCTSRDEQCAVFGRHLRLTSSCPYTQRSCSVICQGKNECVDLRATFLDGSVCGQGGHCVNGMCSEFGSDAIPAGQGNQLFGSTCRGSIFQRALQLLGTGLLLTFLTI